MFLEWVSNSRVEGARSITNNKKDRGSLRCTKGKAGLDAGVCDWSETSFNPTKKGPPAQPQGSSSLPLCAFSSLHVIASYLDFNIMQQTSHWPSPLLRKTSCILTRLLMRHAMVLRETNLTSFTCSNSGSLALYILHMTSQLPNHPSRRRRAHEEISQFPYTAVVASLPL